VNDYNEVKNSVNGGFKLEDKIMGDRVKCSLVCYGCREQNLWKLLTTN
jgi:hypothetical protein